MVLQKTHAETSFYAPLEEVVIGQLPGGAKRVVVADSAGRVYVDRPADKRLRFAVRGDAGR